MALRGVKTLLFNKSCMTFKHDACDSSVRLADRQMRLFVAYYRRLSTIGKQYLIDLRTGDCWSAIPAGLADTRRQWLHGVSPSTDYGSNLHNKVWVNIISDGCQSLIKARPLFKVKPGQRKSGEYHMTPTPLPLNVYLGPPLLVLRWYLYPDYLTVTHGWVHDKFRSIII